MFEKLNSPQDVFSFKLGSALQMEQTVLGMLGDLQKEAQRDELKRQFSHHADETQQQIRNIEQAFDSMGEKPDDKPCAPMQAIEKEGKLNIKKASDDMVDEVILAGAAETEHHEIAVYEALITQAQALGRSDIARLLEQNLEQERHTLQEVQGHMQRVARETAVTA
jgi:ferritin-like metal-binding protein YciE